MLGCRNDHIHSKGVAKREHCEVKAHPAQALDTDVIGIRSTRRAINDPVPELIVGRAACHPAEQLTPVLHQD